MAEYTAWCLRAPAALRPTPWARGTGLHPGRSSGDGHTSLSMHLMSWHARIWQRDGRSVSRPGQTRGISKCLSLSTSPYAVDRRRPQGPLLATTSQPRDPSGAKPTARCMPEDDRGGGQTSEGARSCPPHSRSPRRSWLGLSPSRLENDRAPIR